MAAVEAARTALKKRLISGNKHSFLRAEKQQEAVAFNNKNGRFYRLLLRRRFGVIAAFLAGPLTGLVGGFLAAGAALAALPLTPLATGLFVAAGGGAGESTLAGVAAFLPPFLAAGVALAFLLLGGCAMDVSLVATESREFLRLTPPFLPLAAALGGSGVAGVSSSST